MRALLLLTVVVSAVACTAFGTSGAGANAAADGGLPDVVTAGDASAVDGDGGSGAGFLGCDDYTKDRGAPGVDGNAEWTSGNGWSITLSPTGHGAVSRVWQAPFAIRRSTLTLVMAVTIDEAVTKGHYANVFAQYYGSEPNFSKAIPVNAASFVSDVGTSFKIDLWPNGGVAPVTHSETFGVFDFNGEFTVSTRWDKDAGSVAVTTTGGLDFTTMGMTTNAANGQNMLTVEVGGSSDGGEIHYVVRRMCMTVEP